MSLVEEGTGCGRFGASVYGHRLGFFLKNFNLHRVLLFTFSKNTPAATPVKIQRLNASLFVFFCDE